MFVNTFCIKNNELFYIMFTKGDFCVKMKLIPSLSDTLCSKESKMKRFLVLVTVLICAACLLLSCNGNKSDTSNTGGDEPHSHVFGEWYRDTIPTCSNFGYESRSCECGEREEREVEKTGHAFGEWEHLYEATCTREGEQIRYCGACGEQEIATIEMIDHAFGEWEPWYEATCTREGEEIHQCNCGYSEIRFTGKAPHNFGAWRTIKTATCVVKGEEERSCTCGASETRETNLDVNAHSFGAWELVNSGTCTANGEEKRTCACGASETRATDKIAHAYGDWTTVKAATCTANGEEKRTCTCGASETRSTEKIAHSYGSWTVVKAFGCYENGEEKRSCACGHSETRTIEKSHTLQNDGTCAICRRQINGTNGIVYTLSDDRQYYIVTGYKGTEKNIIIADEYNWLPVKVLASGSISSNITGITVSASITDISNTAFDYKVENITVSEANAVYKSIDGNLYSKDGKTLLKYAPGKTAESFEIPSTVTTVAEKAFDNYSIKNIFIPESVTNIAPMAFISKIESFTVSEDSTSYWSYNGNLYSKDGTILIRYASGKTDTSYTVGYGIRTIESYAFYGSENLISVIISDTVLTIGDGAFLGCTQLYSVQFGEELISIGKSAFENCFKLSAVVIPKNVTHIGDYAFKNCWAVSFVKIPKSVNTIGAYVFDRCDSLINVYYAGTEAEWKAINNTSNFSNVNIHYNFTL